MALLAALSTGHKLGLALTAAAWIAFALVVSLLVPRFRPQFPGRRGLPLFLIVIFLFFLAMLAAVEVFGAEPKEKSKGAVSAPSSAPGQPRTVKVSEVDFKILFPNAGFTPGAYTFDLTNNGQTAHDLTINGPGVNNSATPKIGPGKTATLKVKLAKGTYELYCSVPGHKQLGMDTHITVG